MRFDVFSAIGARLVGSRWNSPGLGVIYASRTFSGAMFECLAHAGIGRVPRPQVALEISISGAVAVEWHDEHSLPAGWDDRDLAVARALARLPNGRFGADAYPQRSASPASP